METRTAARDGMAFPVLSLTLSPLMLKDGTETLSMSLERERPTLGNPRAPLTGSRSGTSFIHCGKCSLGSEQSLAPRGGIGPKALSLKPRGFKAQEGSKFPSAPGETGAPCGADIPPAASPARRLLSAPLRPLALSGEPGSQGCQLVLDAREEARALTWWHLKSASGEVHFTHVCARSTGPAPFGLWKPRGSPFKDEPPGMEEVAPRGTREGRPCNSPAAMQWRSGGQRKPLFPV